MINTYLENAVLNHLFRGQAYTAPSTLYLGVSKSAPNEAGTGFTEPTAPSYARYEITSNTANWTEPTTGSLSNSTAFRFVEAEESWTTAAAPLTHWAIFDAPTGGNMLFFGSLLKPQEVPAGGILEIPQNALVTTILNA